MKQETKDKILEKAFVWAEKKELNIDTSMGFQPFVEKVIVLTNKEILKEFSDRLKKERPMKYSFEDWIDKIKSRDIRVGVNE